MRPKYIKATKKDIENPKDGCDGTTNPGGIQKLDNPLKGIQNTITQNLDNPLKGIQDNPEPVDERVNRTILGLTVAT